MAAGVGQLEVVQVLRSKGADLDAVDERGDSAATWAARHGHPAVLSYLISEGANVDSRNKVRWRIATRGYRSRSHSLEGWPADNGGSVAAILGQLWCRAAKLFRRTMIEFGS